MADDLLISVGADVAGFRRDRATILAEVRGLQRDMLNALQGAQILPDLGTQARTAGQSVIAGLREAIQGGGAEIQRDVSDALIPRSLAGDVLRLRTTVRAGIDGISKDFASEGATSAAAFLAELDRGLVGARAVFGGFARQVTATLSGSRGILGDLAPQAEAAGLQLVTGLRRTIGREAGSLQTEISRALVPVNAGAAYTPLLAATRDAAGVITATFAVAGRDSGRAITAGLAAGITTSTDAIARFALTAANTLERAQILSGLGEQGQRAGALMIGGVVRAIGSGAGEIQRAVSTALVPTNLPGALAAVTAAVQQETAKLTPLLANTGTDAGRGLVLSLSRELTTGATTAVTAFSRGALTAIAGTNLLGDLTPVGERAGQQLSAGVQRALTQQSAALRSTITAAIVPANIGTSLAGLETSLTSSLARFPALFETAGVRSGGALVSGITAQLGAGRAVLTSFAADTSRALTAALTIGDVSGAGDRAGRALAAAIAGGVAAEAPRVRGALSQALIPSSLTTDVARITSTVVTETAKLAPALAVEGAQAGRALVQGLTTEVSRGAQAMRALTAGATIGVVVDSAPIREATKAQRELAAATEQTAAAMKQVDAAALSIDPAGIQQATTATRTLADAQREWLKEARGGSVAAQGLWQRQREAARAAANEARTIASQSTRNAQQEAAARAQVRAELVGEIATLGRYASTVNATSAAAVAGWRKEAAAIRQQAVEVGLSRDKLLQLDAVIKRTEQSFARQQMAAQRAAQATTNSALPGGLGARTISGDINVITREANKAKRAVDQVTIGGRNLSSTMSRLGPALVGVSFGLEALARGGTSADAGVRTALRAVASFAAFFGPTGFIVAGVAAATAAILDLFAQTRDQVRETQEQFVSSVNAMLKSGDITGLRQKFKDLDLGVPDITKGGKLTGGVVELSRELENLKRTAAGFKFPGLDITTLPAIAAYIKLRLEVRGLKGDLIEAQKESEQLAKLFTEPTEEMKRALAEEAATKAKEAAEAAARAFREWQEQIRGVITTYAQLAGDSQNQVKIAAQLIPIYDEVARKAAKYGASTSESARAVRDLLASLAEVRPVQVELATRRLTTDLAPSLPPLAVTGMIDKVIISPAVTIPPLPFDPAELSKSLSDALEQARRAQGRLDFSEIFGTRQDVADASEDVTIATANLRKEIIAASDELDKSGYSDAQKAQRLAVLVALYKEVAQESNAATDDVRTLSDTLTNLGGAAFSIARVVDEIGGVDREIIDAIDSAGRLADALGELSRIKLSGEGGIFSSFNKFLEGLPAIGSVISSAISAYRSVFGVITGKNTADANTEIVRQNTEALTRLAQDLAGWGNTIGDLFGDARVIQESQILQSRRSSGFDRGFRNVEALDQELRAAGSSIADLKRRAEELGITIVDAKGRISAQGLDALNTALLLTAYELATFSNTLKDATFIADARREIFDDTSATTVAKDWLDQLRQFAPDLFSQFFGGANAATREGRAIFEQGIRDAFEAAAANEIDPKVIKAFGSIEGFVEFLLGADRALDELAESAREAAGQMVNVASGFAVSNRVFKAITDGLNQREFITPPTPRPTPIPTGAGGGASASISLTVDVGGLTVGAPAQTKDQIYAAVRRQALDKASALGPTYRDAVEAALPA